MRGGEGKKGIRLFEKGCFGSEEGASQRTDLLIKSLSQQQKEEEGGLRLKGGGREEGIPLERFYQSRIIGKGYQTQTLWRKKTPPPRFLCGGRGEKALPPQRGGKMVSLY